MPRYHDNEKAAIFELFTGVFGSLEASCYFDVSTGLTGPEAEVLGRGRMVVFSSYSYLSLNGHPRIQAAAKAAIDQYGTGAAGVRGVSGTNSLHVALEQKVARWFNKEDALVFGSGFSANEAGMFGLF